MCTQEEIAILQEVEEHGWAYPKLDSLPLWLMLLSMTLTLIVMPPEEVSYSLCSYVHNNYA